MTPDTTHWAVRAELRSWGRPTGITRVIRCETEDDAAWLQVAIDGALYTVGVVRVDSNGEVTGE